MYLSSLIHVINVEIIAARFHVLRRPFCATRPLFLFTLEVPEKNESVLSGGGHGEGDNCLDLSRVWNRRNDVAGSGGLVYV
jgi:hypothetical protein